VAYIHDRAIVCSLGELIHRRRYYKKQTANGTWVYAYLLDELLGIPKGATISPRLAELIARRWPQVSNCAWRLVHSGNPSGKK